MSRTRYKVVYEQNDNPELGVYGISVVDTPANRMEAIALSEQQKEQIKLRAENATQQTLTGVVLIPNQVIPRVNPTTGEEYEVIFPEQTIVNLSRDFMKKGYQNMSSYNHDENNWLQGVTVVESWLISHETMDKAFALGFKDLPVGTWMITMKLSDENWKKYVETGLVKGFSIDSYLPMEKITMQANESNNVDYKNKTNLKSKTMNLISEFLKLMKQHSVKLASAEVEGVIYYADAFEVDYVVYMEHNGEMVPVTDATFEYEGFTYTTDAEGKIVTKEAIMEQPEMETPEEEQPEMEMEVNMEDLPAEVVGDVMVTTENIEEEVLKPVEEIDVEALKARISELEAQLETIMEEKATVLEENMKLKAQPVSTKLRAIAQPTKQKETTLEALARIASQKK